ncbi:MAG: hypothetical protein WDM76_14805 [Limisphaerales bacterium]
MAGSAHAQTFTYNTGDVLVGFRKTASPVNDLVVNAGPISTFTNLAIGQKITIAQFTGSQLAAVGTNNMAWSVFAIFDNNNPGAPTNTLWVTRARVSLNTQSAPWNRQSYFGQATTASYMDSVGVDAITIGSGLSTGANNTPTAVVETESGHSTPGGFANCYAYYVGGSGNFLNSFPGNVEQTTAANFTTAGQPVRADFYQLVSASVSSPGTYLGYFEFSTNGVLTYTAGPSSIVIPAPVITAITRSGTTSTVFFTTVSGGTYSLRGTNSAGLAAAKMNWPVIASIAGNGLTNSLTEITTNSSQFYIISAQ